MLLSLLGTLLSLAAAALARSSTGSSVLVILEPKLKQDDYSLFFGGLRGMYVLMCVLCLG